MSTTMTMEREPRKITGRMVLFGMIAFFGVIAAVNGVFMYFALGTWPGLTTEDAYKKGIAYNQTLAAGEKQAALGWRSAVAVEAGAAGTPLPVTVTFKDRAGAPVGGLRVQLIFERAVGQPMRRELTLAETTPGTYSGSFDAPLMGRWKADIEATGPSEQTYRMIHEVMLKP